MTALPKNSDALPSDDIVRLHRAGVALVPLGGGIDGKSPLCAFKDRIPLGQILGVMRARGSSCYGALLDGLAVVDCDTRDPVIIAQMEQRFGPASVQVRTPRGVHLYYQHDGGGLPNLRAEGLDVDIKRGSTSYVMGPGSRRPDGGFYEPVVGCLGETELSAIKSESRRAPVVGEGQRNRFLSRRAIEMVEAVNSVDELIANLQFIRDEECDAPETIPDSELSKIATWSWEKRLTNSVYSGRRSEYRLNRMATDALRQLPNASDAIALYVTLVDVHGHQHGKAFKLSHDGMRSAGYTDLSRERFLAARRGLESCGLLRVSQKHSAGRFERSYQLLSPLLALQSPNTPGGRGLSLTYVDGIPSTVFPGPQTHGRNHEKQPK